MLKINKMPSTLTLNEEFAKTRFSQRNNRGKSTTPSFRIFENALKSAFGPQKSRKAKAMVESLEEYINHNNSCFDVSPARSTTESIRPVIEESRSLDFISKSVIPVTEDQSYLKEIKNNLENAIEKQHEYVQQNTNCHYTEDKLRPPSKKWPCFTPTILDLDEAVPPNFTSTHNCGSPNSMSETCSDYKLSPIHESFGRGVDEYRLPLTFERSDKDMGHHISPTCDDYLLPTTAFGHIPTADDYLFPSTVGDNDYSLPLTVERSSMDSDYYSPFTSDRISTTIKKYSHLTPDRTNADIDYTLNFDGLNMNADDYRLPIMRNSPIIGVDGFEVPFTSVNSDVGRGNCKFPSNFNSLAAVEKQCYVFPIDRDSTSNISMKFDQPVGSPQLSSTFRYQDDNYADRSSGYLSSPLNSDSSYQNSPDQPEMSYYHMIRAMGTCSLNSSIQPDKFSPTENVSESMKIEKTAYGRARLNRPNLLPETRSKHQFPLSHTVNQSRDYSTSPNPGFYSEQNNSNFQRNLYDFPQKAGDFDNGIDEFSTDQKWRSSPVNSLQSAHNNASFDAELQVSCIESCKMNLETNRNKISTQSLDNSMSPNHSSKSSELGNIGLKNGLNICLQKVEDSDKNTVNDVNQSTCRNSPVRNVSQSLHHDAEIKKNSTTFIKPYSENNKSQVDKDLFSEADKPHQHFQSNGTLPTKITYSRDNLGSTYKRNEIPLLSLQDSGSKNSSCKSCEVTQELYKNADVAYKEKRQWNILPDYCASTLMTLKSKTGFFDAHCHLDFLFSRQQYPGTHADYQAKHKETYPESYRGCIAVFCKPFTFYKKYMWQKYLSQDDVWGAFGCHPHEAEDYDDKIEEWLKSALMHPKVRALGEIGLDYSDRNNCSKEIQHQVFRRQLKIAMDRQLRLVIHCRDANEDCISILQEFLPEDYTFHLHCFTDNWAWAEKWMKAFPNVFIGITNLVTYNSAKPTHEVARRIPLNRLLLETDAPYFVPRMSPPDTKYSHPGMAIYVAAQIAALRDIPTDEVLQWTFRNTKFVYNI